jgi:hypothetical protein
MLRGIGLAYHVLSLELIEDHNLDERVHERGGEREIQLLWTHQPRLLPVWDEDRLRLVTWGCRRGESRHLPAAGCTWLATVEAGGWKQWRPRPVDIPATLVLENQVWTSIREGLRGLLITDEDGIDRVFIICEPSTYYYRVMTRSDWMPCLINERF